MQMQRIFFLALLFCFVSVHTLAQDTEPNDQPKAMADADSKDGKKDGTTDEARAEALKRLVPNLTALREELDKIEKEHGA